MSHPQPASRDQLIPVCIKETVGGSALEWLAGGPIAGPLFEDAVRARRRELTSEGVSSRWTHPDALIDEAPVDADGRPAALLFHTSRCGSTLLTRVMSALDDSAVIAESVILDQLLNGPESLASSDAVRMARLRGFVHAHARTARSGRCWVKFDCHHIFHFDLIRRAFPGVPWVFLYRDPLEVVVSHSRLRGLPMIPTEAEAIAWPGYGERLMKDLMDEHTARMVARFCTIAAEEHRPGESLLVNHRDFAARMHTEILPFLGVAAGTDAEREHIRQCLWENAKRPGQSFTADSADKRAEASAVIRNAVERWARESYDRLEQLATAPTPAGQPG